MHSLPRALRRNGISSRVCSSRGRRLLRPCSSTGNADLRIVGAARSFSQRTSLAPLALVLDIDETLLRPKFVGVAEHASRKLAWVDHEVTIRVGEGVTCQLSLRPGLPAFLEWVKRKRNAGEIEGPWIFAQGVREYVEAVLSVLDPDRGIFEDRILSRTGCTTTRIPGYVLKDLSKVSVESMGFGSSLSRVLLVDNNAISAIMYPDNVVLIRDWRGDGSEDSDLARVTGVLDAVLSAVRGSDGALDYPSAYLQQSPRHEQYRTQLLTLRDLVDSDLQPGEPLSKRLKETWAVACQAKQEALGLSPGEF